MGIALLKKLNSNLPDPIKKAFAPVIRKKLIGNNTFLDQMEELQKTDELSESELQKLQFEKLKETLIHAYEHTVYYKKLFDSVNFDPYSFSDLSEMKMIPLLTKQLAIENFEQLQADDIDDYYSATTGGTTGTPLKIHLDKKSIYRERAFIYHFWTEYGYDYHKSKTASFRGTDFNGKICKSNPLYNEIQLNPCLISLNTIAEYCKRMDKYGVEFLHGFPSAIYNLCKFANAAHIDLKKKYKAVFTISENLYDFQKELILSTLQCPIASFYGHSERAVFAEAYKDGYSFDKMYCYTEFTGSDDGEIICTGFLNRKMPFIRYHVDDTASKHEDYYKITGHREGLLSGRNDTQISVAALEVHSKILSKVASYQFYQPAIGKLEVRVVPIDAITDNDKNDISALFQGRVGDAFDVSVKVVNELEATGRGKYRLLIKDC